MDSERDAQAGEHCAVSQRKKIKENPFDVLAGRVYEEAAPAVSSSAPARILQDDSLFLAKLQNGRASRPGPQARPRRDGVYRRIQVFSSQQIQLPTRKYYKFPFCGDFKNDGSMVFAQVHEGFMKALTSAYANYRRFREHFIVLVGQEWIEFGEGVAASRGLAGMLSQNGINGADDNEVLEIRPEDVALVYDTVLNIPVPLGSALPFIFSRHEFDHATVYHTRVERGPIVRTGASFEYSATLHGPAHSADYPMDGASWAQYIP